MDTDVTKMEGKRLRTSLLGRWHGVKQRTTPSYWEEYPSYTGVKMCPEWRDSFENFRDDVMTLKGHDLLDGNGKSFEIDKDLLSGRCKRYSLETCCFLPKEINYFLRSPSKSSQGCIPTVTPVDYNQYMVSFGGLGEFKVWGIYPSIEVAYRAYCDARKSLLDELTLKWRDHLSDDDVVEALGSFDFRQEDWQYEEELIENEQGWEGGELLVNMGDGHDSYKWEYPWEKYCVKNSIFKEILPIS